MKTIDHQAPPPLLMLNYTTTITQFILHNCTVHMSHMHSVYYQLY